MQKINNRIPGNLPPPPKSEIDGKITDLSSKTITELMELLERQEKLLSNKVFLSKLQDKGKKLQEFHDKIFVQLQKKREEEEACHMLENLKLSGLDSQSVQLVEWTGKIDKNNEVYLDSDDDSEPEDALHILSQSTASEKVVKVIEPHKSLITPEDLLEINELPHVKYIVDKTETSVKPKEVEKFKPYKTTKSDVHNPEKEITRCEKSKFIKWEVTAATPPPIIHGPAKILPITESLRLQQEYNVRLKEIGAQHAAEKLAALSGIKMAKLPKDTSKFGKYRNVDSDESDASDSEGSDKEVHDEEPERGGVVFTVMK